jgi:ribonucleoside-triphosphate reductase
LNDATYLIGITGLNELVQIREGRQLHESDDALARGLAVIGHMQGEAEQLCGVHGMQIVLEQTPAETPAYRFARLDLKHFSPLPGRYVLGDLVRGDLIHELDSPQPCGAVDPLTR